MNWNFHGLRHPAFFPGPAQDPAPVAQRDELWWLAPAVCTPLALLLAYLDYSESFMSSAPLVWKLGYLWPAGLVVGSWLVERTRARRDLRIGLGVSGCLIALVYGKAMTAVAYAVGIVLWLKYGD